MNSQSDLWQRLEAFQFDAPGAALPFEARLARENGWSREFARRAILEYKRFLFLCATAPHVVTPSDEVDQVWHLHLTYTRSYWEELCGKILPKPLHHEPTRGGTNERAKFFRFYAQTLQSYREIWEEPPADLWPPASIRFAPKKHVRADLNRHILMPRPRVPRHFWPALGAIFLLAGCGASALGPFDWRGPEFLSFFFALSFFVIIGSWVARWFLSLPDTPADNDDLPHYALARLADRGNRPLEAAVASLWHQGHIKMADDGFTLQQNPGQFAPRETFEIQIWELIGDGMRWGELQKRAKPLLSQWDGDLERRGLLVDPQVRPLANGAPVVGALFLMLVALIKTGIGLDRHKPVGFLILSLIVLGIYALAVGFGASVWQSRRGQTFLAKQRARPHPFPSPRESMSVQAAMVVAAVAIFGISELSALGLMPLQPIMRPPASGSDGGSSSGCSGGGDGGSGGCGGGGCGGCGGGGGD